MANYSTLPPWLFTPEDSPWFSSFEKQIPYFQFVESNFRPNKIRKQVGFESSRPETKKNDGKRRKIFTNKFDAKNSTKGKNSRKLYEENVGRGFGPEFYGKNH